MTANLITNFDWQGRDFTDLSVLDLACGNGRNGLWFAEKGAKVHFIDRDLSQVEDTRSGYPKCQFSQWDMETENAPQLAPSSYDVILVFNYLHRPLLSQIAAALKPNGLLFYETFTREQAKIGRPKNPDFLLEKDELNLAFTGWIELHSQQGKMITAKGGKESYKAQLISQKPRL